MVMGLMQISAVVSAEEVAAVEAVAEQADAAVEVAAVTIAVETVEGTISSIDADAKVIVLEHATAENTTETAMFQFSEETVVMKGTEEVALSTLKAGDVVALEYTAENGSNVVTAITQK